MMLGRPFRLPFVLPLATVLATLVSVASTAAAVTLTRYPSVWLRTPGTITVYWQTDVSATGKILYGPTPGAPTNEGSHGGAGTEHVVELQGLDPGIIYFYRVISGTDTLTSGADRFRTSPDTDEPFRYLAFGDLGRATPEQIQIAARIDSLNADLAILTGDIIYEAGEVANFTPQYFDIYRSTIARIPFYPSLGNHDVITLGGQPYLDAFHLPSNNPAGTERYFSFDYSNAHFVCLEVVYEGLSPDPDMLAWLDADLAASTATWNFVFFHVPMYSNWGSHGPDIEIATALEPILNAHGVDIVFQGHNHYYTRTYPILGGTAVATTQEPTYVNPGGTIYIVTGGAGRFLHALGTPASYEVFSKSTFHLTSVDVIGNTLHLRAIERDGTVIDEMTLSKEIPTGVVVSGLESARHSFALQRVRPNPSGGAAEIGFTLDRAGEARLNVYDARGRLVRTITPATPLGPGPHAVTWDGRDGRGGTAPAGLYFVELVSEGRRARAKIVRVP